MSTCECVWHLHQRLIQMLNTLLHLLAARTALARVWGTCGQELTPCVHCRPMGDQLAGAASEAGLPPPGTPFAWVRRCASIASTAGPRHHGDDCGVPGRDTRGECVACNPSKAARVRAYTRAFASCLQAAGVLSHFPAQATAYLHHEPAQVGVGDVPSAAIHSDPTTQPVATAVVRACDAVYVGSAW